MTGKTACECVLPLEEVLLMTLEQRAPYVGVPAERATYNSPPNCAPATVCLEHCPRCHGTGEVPR